MFEICKYVYLVFASLFVQVSGHGYLVEPPQRSSLWRNHVGAPENFNDNALNCGGFVRHWIINGGLCGVCGDAFDLPTPRPNEDGGLYGRGIIIRDYVSGDVIQIVVNLTANHRGWFEFRLCPHDDVSVPVSEECLNKYLLPIYSNDGTQITRTRLHVGDSRLMAFKIKLPEKLTCKKCVLQWKYNAGNSWGCDENCCGLGCGKQEQFYNCADIRISTSEKTKYKLHDQTIERNDVYTKQVLSPYLHRVVHKLDDDGYSSLGTNREKDISSNFIVDRKLLKQVTHRRLSCKPTSHYEDVLGMRSWCARNCPRCPQSHCVCS